MLAFASVRSHVLLGALVCASGATACDGGDSGSGGAEGSSGSTTSETASSTDATATIGSASASATGSTGSDESTSTGSASTEGSGSTTGTSGEMTSSSSSGDTTGSAAVDVPFTVHDPSGLELTARVPEGWVLIATADAWAAFTDAPVPEGVTFPDQWVLFGSRGPLAYPGHALSVDALTWQGDTLTVSGDQVNPADDCETYEFIWPADTLLSFDAVDGSIADIADETATDEVSCAGGAGDSANCDLDTPCATGLLCAGIIRNTVLSSDPGGFCLDSSYRGTFSGPAVTIPADGATAEVSMQVAGLTTVDMDVTILLDLDHPAPEELVIALRNPDGNEVSVANLQTTALHPGGVPIVPTGFSGDESVNGTWTLVVRDTVDNANSGSVSSWDLEIMSRYD